MRIVGTLGDIRVALDGGGSIPIEDFCDREDHLVDQRLEALREDSPLK